MADINDCLGEARVSNAKIQTMIEKVKPVVSGRMGVANLAKYNVVKYKVVLAAQSNYFVKIIVGVPGEEGNCVHVWIIQPPKTCDCAGEQVFLNGFQAARSDDTEISFFAPN